MSAPNKDDMETTVSRSIDGYSDENDGNSSSTNGINRDRYYDGVYYGDSDDDPAALLLALDEAERNESSFDILADHGEFSYSEHDQRMYTPALDIDALLPPDNNMLPISEEEGEVGGGTASSSLYEIPSGYRNNRSLAETQGEDELDDVVDDEDMSSQTSSLSGSEPSRSIQEKVVEINTFLDDAMQQQPSNKANRGFAKTGSGANLWNRFSAKGSSFDENASAVSDASFLKKGTVSLVQELVAADASYLNSKRKSGGSPTEDPEALATALLPSAPVGEEVDAGADTIQQKRYFVRRAIWCAILIIVLISAAGTTAGLLIAKNRRNNNETTTEVVVSPGETTEKKNETSFDSTNNSSALDEVNNSSIGFSNSSSNSSDANDQNGPSSSSLLNPSMRPSTAPWITSTNFPSTMPTNTISLSPVQTASVEPSVRDDNDTNEPSKEDNAEITGDDVIDKSDRPWDDDDFQPIEIQGDDDFYKNGEEEDNDGIKGGGFEDDKPVDQPSGDDDFQPIEMLGEDDFYTGIEPQDPLHDNTMGVPSAVVHDKKQKQTKESKINSTKKKKSKSTKTRTKKPKSTRTKEQKNEIPHSEDSVDGSLLYGSAEAVNIKQRSFFSKGRNIDPQPSRYRTYDRRYPQPQLHNQYYGKRPQKFWYHKYDSNPYLSVKTFRKQPHKWRQQQKQWRRIPRGY
ncbi:unnamed protein product [Pseudo-nitzschia multistriata]|uniref:Uncharacterized protein n=1 Tax=Pseudo-nitzschia multistriata TaxID=183589 RepID=A0A448ZR45_9STRA|nr:unnamed protein product [Pseudo-nitzschia multistriata]